MLSVHDEERIQKVNPGVSGNSDAISTVSFSQRKSSWMRCLIFIEQKKKKKRLQIHIPPRIVTGSKDSSTVNQECVFALGKMPRSS